MYDIDIREPLFDYLDETYGKNRILEEKTMGRSRADVIMILEHEWVGFEWQAHRPQQRGDLRQYRTDYPERSRLVLLHGHCHLQGYQGICAGRQDHKCRTGGDPNGNNTSRNCRRDRRRYS